MYSNFVWYLLALNININNTNKLLIFIDKLLYMHLGGQNTRLGQKTNESTNIQGLIICSGRKTELKQQREFI